MGKNRFARGLPLITAWIPPCPRQLQSFAKLVVRLLPLANGSIAYAFVFEVTELTRFFRCQGGLCAIETAMRWTSSEELSVFSALHKNSTRPAF